jgi:hypothetical protein
MKRGRRYSSRTKRRYSSRTKRRYTKKTRKKVRRVKRSYRRKQRIKRGGADEGQQMLMGELEKAIGVAEEEMAQNPNDTNRENLQMLNRRLMKELVEAIKALVQHSQLEPENMIILGPLQKKYAEISANLAAEEQEAASRAAAEEQEAASRAAAAALAEAKAEKNKLATEAFHKSGGSLADLGDPAILKEIASHLGVQSDFENLAVAVAAIDNATKRGPAVAALDKDIARLRGKLASATEMEMIDKVTELTAQIANLESDKAAALVAFVKPVREASKEWAVTAEDQLIEKIQEEMGKDVYVATWVEKSVYDGAEATDLASYDDDYQLHGELVVTQEEHHRARAPEYPELVSLEGHPVMAGPGPCLKLPIPSVNLCRYYIGQWSGRPWRHTEQAKPYPTIEDIRKVPGDNKCKRIYDATSVMYVGMRGKAEKGMWELDDLSAETPKMVYRRFGDAHAHAECDSINFLKCIAFPKLLDLDISNNTGLTDITPLNDLRENARLSREELKYDPDIGLAPPINSYPGGKVARLYVNNVLQEFKFANTNVAKDGYGPFIEMLEAVPLEYQDLDRRERHYVMGIQNLDEETSRNIYTACLSKDISLCYLAPLLAPERRHVKDDWSDDDIGELRGGEVRRVPIIDASVLNGADVFFRAALVGEMGERVTGTAEAWELRRRTNTERRM